VIVLRFLKVSCFSVVSCQLGNCDIDFIVFRHRLRITRLKFLKFERSQNSAVKFQIAQKKKREIVKLSKVGTSLYFIKYFLIC
jgi:hypothetical protein